MLLYFLAGGIGFILAKLLLPTPVSPFFQDVVMRNIRDGKRVAIAIETDVTIFEMVQDNIKITRGQADFFKIEEPEVEVPIKTE